MYTFTRGQLEFLHLVSPTKSWNFTNPQNWRGPVASSTKGATDGQASGPPKVKEAGFRGPVASYLGYSGETMIRIVLYHGMVSFLGFKIIYSWSS